MINLKTAGSNLCGAMLMLILAACGGGEGDPVDAAQVRVVNATLTHRSLDLIIDSRVTVAAAARDSVSGYANVGSGSPTLQLNDAGVSTVLTSLPASLSKNQHYTVLAYESGGAVKAVVLGDDTAAPSAGTSLLRVFGGAAEAGALDVYVTDPATSLSSLASPTFSVPAAAAVSAPTSSFVSFNTGTYRVRVTGAGRPTDLRLDIPSIALTSQQLQSLVLTSTAGGVLTDGGALIQQGTYTAARNTSARVRLAAGLSASAPIGAAAGTTTIGAGVTSPGVGAYVVVPAASTLAVTVAGNPASLAAPATLTAGGDATLLVYGSAGAPVARLIADDNRLPAALGVLKLRLVNGLPDSAGALTLTSDFDVIASGVGSGTASDYGLVNGSTTLRLDVSSGASTGALYSESNLTVPAASVFTLFMLPAADPAASSPAHILRKDR